MAGQDRTNQYLRSTVDPSNGILADENYKQVYAHRGTLFFISEVDDGTAERVYRFKTGQTPLHVVASLEAGLATEASIIEDVTITGEGDPVSVRNYNRLFADDAMQAKVYSGATYTGGVTFRNTQAGFGSSPGHAVSGQATQSAEYILKPDSEYVFSFTPESASRT